MMCNDCGGRGWNYIASGSLGDEVDAEQCYPCEGTGEVPDQTVAESIDSMTESIKQINASTKETIKNIQECTRIVKGGLL